jgi:hypothetical protein
MASSSLCRSGCMPTSSHRAVLRSCMGPDRLQVHFSTSDPRLGTVGPPQNSRHVSKASRIALSIKLARDAVGKRTTTACSLHAHHSPSCPCAPYQLPNPPLILLRLRLPPLGGAGPQLSGASNREGMTCLTFCKQRGSSGGGTGKESARWRGRSGNKTRAQR